MRNRDDRYRLFSAHYVLGSVKLSPLALFDIDKAFTHTHKTIMHSAVSMIYMAAEFRSYLINTNFEMPQI